MGRQVDDCWMKGWVGGWVDGWVSGLLAHLAGIRNTLGGISTQLILPSVQVSTLSWEYLP